ncbi:MAG TPA: uroporphyrinogen-III synthase [Candidatus Sulfotelmatobacter sp.]
MSKNVRSSTRQPRTSQPGTSQFQTNRPLRGTRVLVGRARHQASALSTALRKLGAQVLEIPFIEIRKPRSFQPLDSALKNLDTYDWLILTSVNGVEAMWQRMSRRVKGRGFSRAAKGRIMNPTLAVGARLRVAAIGPATKKALEQRGLKVDVVPNEYVAESVVRSLKRKVKGKRVLLVRAKVARDVIPRELRQAGAHVDVVEAYETVVPQSSRRRLAAALSNPRQRPHVITFTSSSTVRNFVALFESSAAGKPRVAAGDSLAHQRAPHPTLDNVCFASIGPVTSATLSELGLPVDIQAKEFSIPGLVNAIVREFH